MAWILEFEPSARRQLRKPSKYAAARIIERLEALAVDDNPGRKGIAMIGKFAGYWRYRVGDYRVIVKIEQDRLVIVVLAVGHRREVYR